MKKEFLKEKNALAENALPAAKPRAGRTDGEKETEKRLQFAAAHTAEELREFLGCPTDGLSASQAETQREMYGGNTMGKKAEKSFLRRLSEAFVNPFSAILFFLAVVSACTDVFFAQPGKKNPVTVLVISAMLLISGILRFIQDARSDNAAKKLAEMVSVTSAVKRDGQFAELPPEEIVVGDLIRLSAGDIVPADMRVTECKDLFVGQSALTGESEPAEKNAAAVRGDKSLTECENLLFAGSTVISGSGAGVVLAVGKNILFGGIAGLLSGKPPKTNFDKGIAKISRLLIRFTLIMVPAVLLINGFAKKDWTDALLFAVSVAVGLTPEMLPMIVTASLAKGSLALSRKKVIVRRLNAIQDLGAADILCTDKTGTLTEDAVELEAYTDVFGNRDEEVLRAAALNGFFQTGLKSPIDVAVLRASTEILGALPENIRKTDELPFDFERRRMSVLLSDGEKSLLVTKGAAEEMLACCSFVRKGAEILPLDDSLRALFQKRTAEQNRRGMRVVAVAEKAGNMTSLTGADESDMTLIGCLAFLDPPKPTAAKAVKELRRLGVSVRILTGDNETVAANICKKVSVGTDKMLLGADIDRLSDAELAKEAEETCIFAKLSPAQKARVIRALRANGHVVAYMGDGINDAAALKEADVGISVDTAADIARESADIVLLEKDLTVLKDGIVEGRKTYANMLKYIKITVSSNFGNMFSVLAASIFLPFLPMTSVQLILLNLVYDLSCSALPWDGVDPGFLEKPRSWDAASVRTFMFRFGPISSVFDILSYILLYFLLCPRLCGGGYQTLSGDAQAKFSALFQTGWFVQSMWTQALVIHTLRSPRAPFVRTRASLPVTLSTLAAVAVVTALPFTPIGGWLGLCPLPGVYFLLLVCIVIAYLVCVSLAKSHYVKRYKELL